MTKRALIFLLMAATLFVLVPSDTHANPPDATQVSSKLTGSSGLPSNMFGRFFPIAASTNRGLGDPSPSDCTLTVHLPHKSTYYRRRGESRVKSDGDVLCRNYVPELSLTVALQQEFGGWWYSADKETFEGLGILWGQASAHDTCTKDNFRTRGSARAIDVNGREYSVRRLDSREVYNPCNLP